MPAARAARILQITSYPPPRSGWGVRVQFLKQHLEAQGHTCTVLNTGTSRRVPSPEYETVLGLGDYLRKVVRFTRAGFVSHVHVNGKSPKGLALALAAEAIGLAHGRRPFLTFHAGEDQIYFPRQKAPLWAPLFSLLFAMPARIICNSAAVKARICEYGVSADKVTPIPAFSRQYLQFARVPLGDALETFWQRYDDVLFCYLNMRPGYYPETLLDGLAEIVKIRPNVGLIMCGMMGHQDSHLWQRVNARLQRPDVREHVCLVDDLDHDQFLTALSRAALYVRTPPEDGVSSSVLEALALRTPVVAAQNGTRPAGVIEYPATDALALARAVDDALRRRAEIAAALPTPEIPDTLSDEARILTT